MGLKSSRAGQFWASSLILSCAEPPSVVALDPGVSQGLARAPLSQLKCTLKGHLSRAAGAHFESLLLPCEQILTANLPLGNYQMSSLTPGRSCLCGGWMLRVGKSDNCKCPPQVQDKFQELFANKIGKRSCRINERFHTFGPVGFEKEVRALIISANKKTPAILLIP